MKRFWLLGAEAHELGLFFGAWTLFGLFFAGQRYLVQSYLGREQPFREMLLNWLLCAYAWALLTPLVVWLGRKFPIDRRHWLAALLVHVPASVLVSIVGMLSASGSRPPTPTR
jgi:hypothetical protein